MKGRASYWTEGFVIVLGLASFWPWVYGYRGAWYQCGLVVVLVLLLVVAIARFRRVKRAFDEYERK